MSTQLELRWQPDPRCDYWRFGAPVACGVLHKTADFQGWHGPLCAKCDELRSWLQRYLHEKTDE